MKKSIIVLILISIASVLFSCSDELINEKTDGDLTNEVSPYLKALKKLHRSGNITGHLATRGNQDIQGVIPLCYGDTASVNPGTDIGYVDPDTWATTGNDSIYAYIFDFSNEEGFAVVSTEDWLPDILMYSHDGNFMKYKEPKDSTTLMDQTIKEFEAYVLQTQSEFKKMLAKAVKQFKDIRAWELEKIKEEGVDLGTGAYTIPHLTKSILVDSTLDTFGGKFGLCKVNWNEGSAYSELLTSGQGRCWPIVPLVAKYLSIRQFSNQYKDLTLNWSKWTYFRNIERLDFQSKLDIKKLFYYLGDSDNLRYLNNGVKMPATAFDRIPQTLHNFGLTTTCTVDTGMGFVEQVIFDNGDYQRPTLLQYEIKTGNDTYVRQAIIDGQKIITRKFQCSYSNSTEQVKYCYQYFYHFNYGRDEMNINGYFNWGIFCPTVFREALPAMNPFYAPIPQINTNVRHLKVINTGEIDY